MAGLALLYSPQPNDDAQIIEEIDAIFLKNSKYSCGIIYHKLKQTWILINNKRTERQYKENGLQLLARKCQIKDSFIRTITC